MEEEEEEEEEEEGRSKEATQVTAEELTGPKDGVCVERGPRMKIMINV